MKLLSSNASPYGRKVRACAVALGLEKQIQLIDVDTANPTEMLLAANPLGRIPTLITEDGFAIFDSPVICEYLNGTSDVIPIIPLSGAPRWLCRRMEALGDGLMDAAVGRRQLLVNGVAADHKLAQRHAEAIRRTLDQLEHEKLSLHIDVGIISIACALGYLDLRFEGRWRAGHPKLVAWLADFEKRVPAFEKTRAAP
jgi:glutathione S-transferase